jgi:hypothetical protein
MTTHQTQTCMSYQTQTCMSYQTQTCMSYQTQTCMSYQTQTCMSYSIDTGYLYGCVYIYIYIHKHTNIQAKSLNLVNLQTFDLETYEYCDHPSNADMHVIVPGKFIAMKGPHARTYFRDGVQFLSPGYVCMCVCVCLCV